MKNPCKEKPESRFLPGGVFEENVGSRLSKEKTLIKRAVFLDRDGTINVERGYLLDPNDIELNPTAGDAMRILNELNILTIVITNQAAIDKGLLSLEQFERINEKLWNDLSDMNSHYDVLYYCPHSPEITPECHCRKPKPGLILQASRDFCIDLSCSFMIGDKLSDIKAGQAGGCKTILVLTGQGEKTSKVLRNSNETPPDFVAQTLKEAVEWICSNI
jgi:D,D-heptose 1,7-bisphosphate phosphatase